jgi:fatty-acyl-CoA synthase
MVISWGFYVFPCVVEGVLNNPPGVVVSGVIGVAVVRWGEVGHAVLRLRPGTQLDTAQVLAFARANLAAYKVPKHITVVEDYPRTAAGKVQKHVLRRTVGPRT